VCCIVTLYSGSNRVTMIKVGFIHWIVALFYSMWQDVHASIWHNLAFLCDAGHNWFLTTSLVHFINWYVLLPLKPRDRMSTYLSDWCSFHTTWQDVHVLQLVPKNGFFCTAGQFINQIVAPFIPCGMMSTHLSCHTPNRSLTLFALPMQLAPEIGFVLNIWSF